MNIWCLIFFFSSGIVQPEQQRLREPLSPLGQMLFRICCWSEAKVSILLMFRKRQWKRFHGMEKGKYWPKFSPFMNIMVRSQGPRPTVLLFHQLGVIIQLLVTEKKTFWSQVPLQVTQHSQCIIWGLGLFRNLPTTPEYSPFSILKAKEGFVPSLCSWGNQGRQSLTCENNDSPSQCSRHPCFSSETDSGCDCIILKSVDITVSQSTHLPPTNTSRAKT